MSNELLIKREEILKALDTLMDTKKNLSNKKQEMLPSSRVPVIAIINRKINECLICLNDIDKQL